MISFVPMKIAIIDYGAGNVQSVLFALKKIGHQAVLTNNFDEISTSDKVIFPGVGNAGFAMQQLEKKGLNKKIHLLKQPVLGICLGMQLLCDFTKEEDTKTLGIFDETVEEFSHSLKVPQMGWNQITSLTSSLFEGVKEGAYVYLVHSYYVPKSSATIAQTTYGISYATAICKNNFYGVQFHPEKSSAVGSKILENFLNL